MDPEKVHEIAMDLISKGIFHAPTFVDPRIEQTLFGVHFQNPLGLAAGFDKNAVALDHWHALGFGHVEVGTVTAHPQPGNPKPRLFRLPADQALINRLGFNNQGAQAAALKIRSSHPQIPFGINLGKSKITEIDRAAEDYQESFRALHSFGAYFVINVSSPNTPGLRTLQDKSKLREIIVAMREVNPQKPLFVKVAPDLELSALDDVLDLVTEQRLTGLIATNTTLSRDSVTDDAGEQGGLSGVPLRTKSDQILKHIYLNANQDLILIGVGGIFTGADIYRKIRLGAHLTQLYTGWVYGGTMMVPNALAELVQLMQRDGVRSLEEMRGADAA